MPIDEIKLDRSFISNMGSESSEAIVRTMLELARHLDLDVVAEGVEDRETFAAVAALGCGFTQGTFFTRPLPAAELAEWMIRFGTSEGFSADPLPATSAVGAA